MRQKPPKLNFSPLSIAYRLSVELVSGVMVGLGIGYFVDYIFHTRPWGLIVFMIIGSGAGVINVYRTAKRLVNTQEDDKNG